MWSFDKPPSNPPRMILHAQKKPICKLEVWFFVYPRRPPPPPVWQKTTLFPDFFPATFPKTTSFPGIILPQVRFGRDRCNIIMSTQTIFSAFCRKNISVAIARFWGKILNFNFYLCEKFDITQFCILLGRYQ